MGKLTMWLMAGVVAVALTGCGQSPSAAPVGTYKAKTARAKAAPARPTAKQPTVSSRSTAKAPAKASRPATKAPAAPQAPDAPMVAETGTLKLALRVTGDAPVASVALKVFEQADPAVAVDAPLALTAGTASWEQSEVPPGRYTFQVQALAADGSVIGQGNTEAIVTAGKVSEVALELRVNTAETGTGTSGIAETTEPTEPTEPAQIGGTIGLNVEIF